MTSATLLASLAAQQRRILGIVDGLDDAAMGRPVLPSGWSCAGMLRHLTIMTRFWFVKVMSGRPVAASGDDDFAVPAGVRAAEIVAAYRQQASQALALVADMPLDAPPEWWPVGWLAVDHPRTGAAARSCGARLPRRAPRRRP